jgi:uncharacterized glyoxalase superfamily protein PhnB
MPYVIFEGTAAEAIAFYCEAFGATELPGRLKHLRSLGQPAQIRATRRAHRGDVMSFVEFRG